MNPLADPREMRRRGRNERLFVGFALAAVVLPLGILLWLVAGVAMDGAGRLSWEFLTHYPSRHAALAGVLPAVVGTAYLIALTALIAIPVGVGAAIYLEEYEAKTALGQRLARVIEINIGNLAAVPSVIYGLLGLGLFVHGLGLGRSVLAGAGTMALLILPIIILAAREALRTIPQDLREASLGLGASRWQTTRQIVLPMALPGILTGVILAISRAIGETAPLIVVGALTYITFLPTGPGSPFTALPIQIFNWLSRPQHEFAINAAAGIVVLLSVMLALNAVAIVVRARNQHG